jgi:hypothetical protein
MPARADKRDIHTRQGAATANLAGRGQAAPRRAASNMAIAPPAAPEKEEKTRALAPDAVLALLMPHFHANFKTEHCPKPICSSGNLTTK